MKTLNVPGMSATAGPNGATLEAQQHLPPKHMLSRPKAPCLRKTCPWLLSAARIAATANGLTKPSTGGPIPFGTPALATGLRPTLIRLSSIWEKSGLSRDSFTWLVRTGVGTEPSPKPNSIFRIPRHPFHPNPPMSPPSVKPERNKSHGSPDRPGQDTFRSRFSLKSTGGLGLQQLNWRSSGGENSRWHPQRARRGLGGTF